MTGQIIKRGERTWLIRIYLGEDSLTHKRTYQNYTIHGSKKEAQAYLNNRLRERDLGQLHETSKMTFAAYMEQWLQTAAKAKLRERTLDDYTDIVRRYLAPALGYLRLDKISALQIQEVITNLREERHLAAPTVRKAHVVLSSALDQAVRWGMLAHNPATSVELPRSNRGRRREQIRVLSPEEALRFMKAAPNNRWGTVFIFALNSGMRPGEYFGLQWKDIDWSAEQVVVRRVVYRPRKGGSWRFEEPKTFGSTRSIAMPRYVMEELKRHRERQKREKEVFNATYVDNDLVFAGTNGQPLDGSNLLNRYLKALLRAADVDPRLNLYSLRHSHATLLLAAGVHPKIVAERLGHASIQLTLDVYSHVIPSLQKTAADRLEELFDRND